MHSNQFIFAREIELNFHCNLLCMNQFEPVSLVHRHKLEIACIFARNAAQQRTGVCVLFQNGMHA